MNTELPETPADIVFDTNNTATFVDDKADQLLVKREQEIPQWFIDDIKDQRDASTKAKMGDLHHVARIPVSIVEKWMAEGYNIFDKNNTIQDTIKRLKLEDLSAFIATDRAI